MREVGCICTGCSTKRSGQPPTAFVVNGCHLQALIFGEPLCYHTRWNFELDNRCGLDCIDRCHTITSPQGATMLKVSMCVHHVRCAALRSCATAMMIHHTCIHLVCGVDPPFSVLPNTMSSYCTVIPHTIEHITTMMGAQPTCWTTGHTTDALWHTLVDT